MWGPSLFPGKILLNFRVCTVKLTYEIRFCSFSKFLYRHVHMCCKLTEKNPQSFPERCLSLGFLVYKQVGCVRSDLHKRTAWILALVQMCWFPFPNSWKYFTSSIVYIDVYLRAVRSLSCFADALMVSVIVWLLPGDQWINVKLFTVMCMCEINKKG